MFLGVQDMVPLSDLPPKGLMQTLQLIRSTPGYLGGWPKPGFLDVLPLGLGGTPDQYGFSKLLFGLWRRQGNGFSVLSFDPQLLADVTPNLRAVEAAEPAQIRVHVTDLSQSKLAAWINATWYPASGGDDGWEPPSASLAQPAASCVAGRLPEVCGIFARRPAAMYARRQLCSGRIPGRRQILAIDRTPKPGQWMPENYSAPLMECSAEPTPV